MKLLKIASKRGLALFMALMMCLTLLPAQAMAADEEHLPECGYVCTHEHDANCGAIITAPSDDPADGYRPAVEAQEEVNCPNGDACTGEEEGHVDHVDAVEAQDEVMGWKQIVDESLCSHQCGEDEWVCAEGCPVAEAERGEDEHFHEHEDIVNLLPSDQFELIANPSDVERADAFELLELNALAPEVRAVVEAVSALAALGEFTWANQDEAMELGFAAQEAIEAAMDADYNGDETLDTYLMLFQDIMNNNGYGAELTGIYNDLTLWPNSRPSDFNYSQIGSSVYRGNLGTVNKSVNSTGVLSTNNLLRFVCPYCGYVFKTVAGYAAGICGVKITSSNESVVTVQETTANDIVMMGNGVDSLLVNYETHNAGTATVTVEYYANYMYPGYWEPGLACLNCRSPIVVGADYTWHKYTDQYTIVVGEETGNDDLWRDHYVSVPVSSGAEDETAALSLDNWSYVDVGNYSVENWQPYAYDIQPGSLKVDTSKIAGYADVKAEIAVRTLSNFYGRSKDVIDIDITGIKATPDEDLLPVYITYKCREPAGYPYVGQYYQWQTVTEVIYVQVYTPETVYLQVGETWETNYIQNVHFSDYDGYLTPMYGFETDQELSVTTPTLSGNPGNYANRANDKYSVTGVAPGKGTSKVTYYSYYKGWQTIDGLGKNPIDAVTWTYVVDVTNFVIGNATLEIPKTFSGIDATMVPTDFALEYAITKRDGSPVMVEMDGKQVPLQGKLTLTTGLDTTAADPENPLPTVMKSTTDLQTGDVTYTWTMNISTLPDGDYTITYTEKDAEIFGYDLKVTMDGQEITESTFSDDFTVKTPEAKPGETIASMTLMAESIVNTYTANSNEVDFYLVYSANGGDTSSEPLTQHQKSAAQSVSFPIENPDEKSTKIPTRTASNGTPYTFLGWAETRDAAVPHWKYNAVDGSYTVEGRGKVENVSVAKNGNPTTKILYAVWNIPEGVKQVTGLTKTEIAASALPTGITLPTGVTLAEKPKDGFQLGVDDAGNPETITLLYQIKVTGDYGAHFVMTDPGAAWVGATYNGQSSTSQTLGNMTVSTDKDGVLTVKGVIPSGDTETHLNGGFVDIYVTKTFDRDDVADGDVTNIATANSDPDHKTEDKSDPDDKHTGGSGTPATPEYNIKIEFVTDENGSLLGTGTDTTYGEDGWTPPAEEMQPTVPSTPDENEPAVQSNGIQTLSLGEKAAVTIPSYIPQVINQKGIRWIIDEAATLANLEKLAEDGIDLTQTVYKKDVAAKIVYTRDDVGTHTEEGKTVKGDNIPDKYQVTFQFVPADNTTGSVTGDNADQIITMYQDMENQTGGYVMSASVSPEVTLDNPDTADTDESNPKAEAAAGYHFVKWTKADGTTEVAVADLGNSVNVTNTPGHSTVIVYKAHFSLTTSVTVTYPEAAEDKDKDGEPDAMPTDKTDDTVPVGVTIIVDPNGGTWTPTQSDKWTEQSNKTYTRTATAGETISLAPNPTKDGSVFMGWEKKASDDGKTITFTAQWAADTKADPAKDTDNDSANGDGIPDSWQYTVTYKAVNGTVQLGTGTASTEVSTVVTKLDSKGNPSKNGTATLAGHTPTAEPNETKGYQGPGKWTASKPEANTVITEDTTFTITYVKVTVTPKDGNGEGTWKNGTSDDQVQTPGEDGEVTLPKADDVMPPEGKELDKWQDQDGKTYNPGDTITPDKDLELKPVWKTEMLTVTFNPNNGLWDRNKVEGIGDRTDSLQIQVPYGSTLANPDRVPANPIRTGFVFAGWNTKEDGTGDTFNAGAAVTASFTVYAQWKTPEYTAGLTIAKEYTSVSNIVATGTSVVYQIGVANNTGRRYSNLRIADLMPAGLELTEGTQVSLMVFDSEGRNEELEEKIEKTPVRTPGPKDDGSYILTWTIPELPQGTTVALAYTTTVTAEGTKTLINEAAALGQPDQRNRTLSFYSESGNWWDDLVQPGDEVVSDKAEIGVCDHSNRTSSVTKEATCTETGIRTYICTNCGHTETETIDALGHNMVSNNDAVEATCTEGGHTASSTCSRPGCGHTEPGTSTGSLGHDWDNGVITREPTAEEPGVRTYTCRRNASHTYTEEIPYTPDTPDTPDPTPTPIPDDPTPTVPDPTPVTPAPAEDNGEDIGDENVPLAGVPGLNSTDHFAYIVGYTDGTVRPEANIKRAEVATIFFRLMTDDYRSANWSTVSGFSDVTAGAWYNNAVSTSVKAGLVKGYSNGTFAPEANITRAEFATLAARFLGDDVTGDNVGDFADTVGHWAARDIRRAAQAGWITGEGNKFRPDDPITRAEVVMVINRMLNRAPDAEHLLDDMTRWSDNPVGTWYYADIQEATNSHVYDRSGATVSEIWTAIEAIRDWTALEAEWAANGGASAK